MTLDHEDSAPISAVILNYNYVRYVGEAIRAALAQTRPFAQVIVVNDGSTDASLSVIRSFGPAVQLLDIPNRGQLGACREGLAAVTAPYVYYLDADDYPDPALAATVARYCDGRAVKVQFQLRGVDQDGLPLESVFPAFPAGYDNSMMREDNLTRGFYVCPPTSGNVFNAEILRGLALKDLDQRDFIDGVPAMVMPDMGPIVTIAHPLACYRVHAASDSQFAKPRPEIMRRDRQRFHSRWSQAVAIVPGIAVPAGPTEYEVELDFLEEALGPRRPRWGTTMHHVTDLVYSRETPLRKALLVGWSIAVATAPRQRRWTMVAARRSSVNRSPRLRRALSRLLR